MENVWVLAAVWVGLALIATLIAIWFRISTRAQRDCCRHGGALADDVRFGL